MNHLRPLAQTPHFSLLLFHPATLPPLDPSFLPTPLSSRYSTPTMSRPGPKPNNDTFNSERVNLIEQVIRHIVSETADEAMQDLLRQLDELRTRQEGHRCTVCRKSYSDAKGLRRHILSAGDEPHAELSGQLSSLGCRWCDRKYAKREQVTKHENICGELCLFRLGIES